MDLVFPRLLFFEPMLKRATRPGGAPVTAKVDTEHHLFCVACRDPITDRDQRIDVRGAHAHTFTNPHGLTFHIGCFRAADGCRAEDPDSVEHTWFPGYAWQIAVCARCTIHLGWRFAATQNVFYGLILDRLTATGNAAS